MNLADIPEVWIAGEKTPDCQFLRWELSYDGGQFLDSRKPWVATRRSFNFRRRSLQPFVRYGRLLLARGDMVDLGHGIDTFH